ncbi:hypothetical protein PAL_GLEAN10001640 [Pteropus alecto]|uniref:Uncharacterized protein n=1 Tax=Pteropus alecto TaxID=9402 RepID=L5K520_PTEAL|nr:hypothetical protein PAL_GLEAN10001640 [Pteropus alecto]
MRTPSRTSRRRLCVQRLTNRHTPREGTSLCTATSRSRDRDHDQTQATGLICSAALERAVSPLQGPPCRSDPFLQRARVLGTPGWRDSATTDWHGTRVRRSLHLPEHEMTASTSDGVATNNVAPTKPEHWEIQAPRWRHPDNIATALTTPWVPARRHCEQPEGAAATIASREVAPPARSQAVRPDSSPWTSEPEPPRDSPLAFLVPYCPLLHLQHF